MFNIFTPSTVCIVCSFHEYIVIPIDRLNVCLHYVTVSVNKFSLLHDCVYGFCTAYVDYLLVFLCLCV